MLLNKQFDQRYAHAVIYEFFSAFGLAGAAWFIETILESAAWYEVWDHKSPDNVLFFMEQLQSLVAAAYLLNNDGINKDAVIEMPGNKDRHKRSYVKLSATDYTCNDAWSHFPRNLTAGQYHNPYKAIHKFCRRMQATDWNHTLKEIMEHALGTSSIHELLPGYNLFRLRRRLLRLIEACHLIYVRINNKTSKHQK